MTNKETLRTVAIDVAEAIEAFDVDNRTENLLGWKCLERCGDLYSVFEIIDIKKFVRQMVDMADEA